MNETIASGSRRARATVLLATILVAWSSLPAAAQSPAPRIRVGLALGGGSARGFAHIGVLQWFEEHRIPIDVVGGTSMGGLIGGAYASGMSPQEIRALVDSLDWSAVLAPDTPFVFKTFRRKEDARAFPSQLNFGLKGGLKLPSGLSPGAQVDLLFDRIAAPYPTDISFNDLPTPFRCVAADLRTARAVVFDAGWLARALRSTMAIPGVFSPVHVDGKVLVDGGVLNNVPADVVKATGLADTVIAVDVGGDLSHEKRSDTIFAVLGETLDVMMRAATRLALQSASLVLVPDLKGFESTDFARADGFVRKGYAAAEAHAAELQRFALSEPDYAAWAAARRARRRTALPAPTFIAVEGVSTLEAAEIQRRLASSLNKPFDADRVDAELTKLTGAGRYEAASYRFEIRDERPGLVVSIRPKSNGPPFLLVGLDLQNTQSSDVTATIRGRVVLFDVVGTGSEGRIDVSLGTTLAASAELYRPVGRTGLFVAPRVFADRRDMPVFLDDQYTAEYRSHARGAGLDVGFSTEHEFETRVGYAVEDVLAETRIGESGLPSVDGAQQYALASAVYDGQTGPTIPEGGLYWATSVRRYFKSPDLVAADGTAAQEPHDLWSGETRLSWFHSVSRRGRLFLRGEGGSSFGDATFVHAFTLGGPFRLGAYYTDELRGSNYVLANVGYFHEVARLAEGAAGRLYFGAWLDEGATFERMRDATFRTSLSAAFILESPIGPVFAGASVGGEKRYRVYVGLGPVMPR